MNFVGWYMAKSRAFNYIEMHDAFHQYLAYYERYGGFGSRDWQGKKRWPPAWPGKQRPRFAGAGANDTRRTIFAVGRL